MTFWPLTEVQGNSQECPSLSTGQYVGKIGFSKEPWRDLPFQGFQKYAGSVSSPF